MFFFLRKMCAHAVFNTLYYPTGFSHTRSLFPCCFLYEPPLDISAVHIYNNIRNVIYCIYRIYRRSLCCLLGEIPLGQVPQMYTQIQSTWLKNIVSTQQLLCLRCKYRPIETKGHMHVCAHMQTGSWHQGVKWELLQNRKYSQGRMFGYLFFSLFSSLLASSYVPWAWPPGRDCRKKRRRLAFM